MGEVCSLIVLKDMHTDMKEDACNYQNRQASERVQAYATPAFVIRKGVEDHTKNQRR